MADVPVADAVAAPGCPVCTLRRRAEATEIRSLLWENVNDVRIRAELDRAGGYCPRHTRAVRAASREQSGPPIGAAILYQAILRQRLSALEAAGSSSGRRGRRGSRAADLDPPRCPVCRTIDGAAARAIDALIARLGDERWVVALGHAEFCLDHLTATWGAAEAARADEGWRLVAQAQIERIESIRARLEAYAHHNSADRRHLLTIHERAAVEQAERLLAGDDREVSSSAG
jgi:hypothetical protein